MTLNDQLELKIRLEEQFRRPVRRLFNRIQREFRISVAAGSPIRASKFQSQWETILIEHYRRVQKAFKGVVKDNTKQTDEEDELLILAALIAWIEENAPEAAGAIINTTQNNMDASIEQARQALSDEGNISYSSRDLAAVAAAILRRKFRGRETSIIMTETQAPAESTKLIEAFGIADLPPMSAVTRQPVLKEVKSIKEWHDVRDDAVRDGHHTSEVPSVPIDQPFTVRGQSMMYPTDNSMGATIDNRINCRCTVFYIFKED